MTTRDEFRQAVKDEYLRRLGASMFDVAADVAERLGMLTEHPGPWEPGQDVTDRLAAGETAPEGTLLADCDGDIYRAESGGRFTDWRTSWGGWWPAPDWAWNRNARGRLSNYAPIRVATPEQIRAAGIEVIP